MLRSNKLNQLGVNRADGTMIRWQFLYLTFIMSVVKN